MEAGRMIAIDAKHSQLVLDLIKELAEFEKAPDGSSLTAGQLTGHLEKGLVEGFLLIDGDEQENVENVIGMTLFFCGYSSWTGPFLNITDLYVRPNYRRQGYGKGLLAQVAKVAYDRGMSRIRLVAMAWNIPAKAFYEREKAINLTETEAWNVYYLDQAAIDRLAIGKP